MSDRLDMDTLEALGGPRTNTAVATHTDGATGFADVVPAVAGKRIRLFSITISGVGSAAASRVISISDGVGTLFQVVMPIKGKGGQSAEINFGRGFLLEAGRALRRSVNAILGSGGVSITAVYDYD
jgi:hypothetical protein